MATSAGTNSTARAVAWRRSLQSGVKPLKEFRAMTFGTTEGKPWVEALPAERGSMFTGRTFSRFHIVGDGGALPTVCEIWATSDHAVKSHAHGSSELLYVLSGAIEVNGR